MKTTNIKIQPLALKHAVLASIGDAKVNLELGKVSLTVTLYDEYGTLVDSRSVDLSGPDYEKWGSDDSYVIAAALAQVGAKSAEVLNLPEVEVKKIEPAEKAADGESEADAPAEGNATEQTSKRKK